MKILVTGAGRGGTNLLTEFISLTDLVNFTKEVEDRNFFNYNVLPENYGTKLATENKGFEIKSINNILEKNPDLYIFFSLRHPIDNCLSKIIRGQPKSKGGDSQTELIAPDATFEGSIESIKHMFEILTHIKTYYIDRLYSIKMEHLITMPEGVADFLINKFNLDEDIKNKINGFYKRNRNQYHKKRYGDSLHKNINQYMDLDNNFNGYFKNNKNIVDNLRTELSTIIFDLGYD